MEKEETSVDIKVLNCFTKTPPSDKKSDALINSQSVIMTMPIFNKAFAKL